MRLFNRKDKLNIEKLESSIIIQREDIFQLYKTIESLKFNETNLYEERRDIIDKHRKEIESLLEYKAKYYSLIKNLKI